MEKWTDGLIHHYSNEQQEEIEGESVYLIIISPGNEIYKDNTNFISIGCSTKEMKYNVIFD